MRGRGLLRSTRERERRKAGRETGRDITKVRPTAGLEAQPIMLAGTEVAALENGDRH